MDKPKKKTLHAKPPVIFSAKAKRFKLGTYQHYKNKKFYKAIGVAYHSDTGRELVVYRALYAPHTLFVRSLEVFMQSVKFEGKRMPRFKHIA